ncbi:endonuclease/exonuclease/phosphatase family protein [Streptomyces sp. HK10]|uniref:endonuclease/exonuclease/phosphatase family protein n=1 Tax=Streptomyces sp. HK10 TaxID=3373255 RepID=UPI003748545F
MTTADRQLSLLNPGAPPRPGATGAAQVLLFNTQHAAPARARRQVAWIAAQDRADLVVLTEVSSTAGGGALIQALTDHGYTTVIEPRPAAPDYRTVLASRTATMRALPSTVEYLPHRAPAAAITIGGHALGLLGLYVPSRGPKERRNEAKRAFQEAVTAALPALVKECGGLVIVAGDLNVVEPGHTPHHAVFGAWEYAFYDSFAAAGLTDAFRHLHPQAADHSWFGRSGRGFRFDHAFVTTGHRDQITHCAYDHTPRREGLSDHAALTLTVRLTPREQPA